MLLLLLINSSLEREVMRVWLCGELNLLLEDDAAEAMRDLEMSERRLFPLERF